MGAFAAAAVTRCEDTTVDAVGVARTWRVGFPCRETERRVHTRGGDGVRFVDVDGVHCADAIVMRAPGGSFTANDFARKSVTTSASSR
jgi:hypothetical protein